MAGHKTRAGVLVSVLRKEWCDCSLAGKVSDKMNLVEYSARDGSCLS